MIDWQNMFSSIPWWLYILYILFIIFTFLQFFILENKKIKSLSKLTTSNKKLYQSILTKKDRRDYYEAYVCKHFREKGYLTVPYRKENIMENRGIDIILKKDKEILFIQCRNLNSKSNNKTDSKEIQYMRMNVRDYLERNKVFSMYTWKILYVTPDDTLDRSAENKLDEYNNEIEHRVIKIG